MTKYIYLLQNQTNNGYDTYDSFVVCAESEEEAKAMPYNEKDYYADNYNYCRPDEQKIFLLGVAVETQEKVIIVASYNAG